MSADHSSHVDTGDCEPSAMRVFHGPANIAGIGGYLSRYQRGRGLVSDFVTWDDRSPQGNHDFDLRVSACRSKLAVLLVKFGWLLVSLARYDVFHFYYGQTLLPLGLDLPILKLFRKKVVMTYCGSDVRLISVEERRNPYSHLLRISANHPKFDARKRMKMRWHDVWCDRFFVARNLVESAATVIPQDKLVTDIWIHNLGFDVAQCPVKSELTTRKRPLLVHAPSEERIKGSKYVRNAIDALRDKGVQFDYREVIGVPNEDAQEIYREADIIVDQFLIGGIGTLAFEGMGLGKPVVAYVIPEVLEQYMPDCPVFYADIDSLADRLQELVENPELRLELGRRGIEFVQEHLDSTRLNEAVIELYRAL